MRSGVERWHGRRSYRTGRGRPGRRAAAVVLGLLLPEQHPVHAQERASGLTGAQAHVAYERDPQDPTRYACIRLDLRLNGVTQEEAEPLAELFTASCPIYNTLRRDGNVVIAVRAESPADRDHRVREEG
ncbi:oxidoreductase [Streptomyces hygroscopicus]|nr:oxidoreductase [Streptomyces hygroscopicus]